MFNFETMIRNSVTSAGVEDSVVAFLYDRPKRALENLRGEGRISGWLGDSSLDFGDGAFGWWSDRARLDIRWKKRAPAILVLVGVDDRLRISAARLFRFRLAGVRRLVQTRNDGSLIREINLMAPHSYREALDTPLYSAEIHDFEAGIQSFIGELGGAFRLTEETFDPRRLIIAIGTLHPGGAERQAANLAAALARGGEYDVYVACHFLDPPNDFFKAEIEAAGGKVVQIPAECPELESEAFGRASIRLQREFPALGLGGVLHEVTRYANLMRTIRAATLHAWLDYHNVLGGLAACLVGTPRLIMGGRSLTPENFVFFQPYMRPGYRAVLSCSNPALLNNSAAGARDYERWLELPNGAIETIHNGFEIPDEDYSTARAELRHNHGWSPHAPVIGTIIRFSEEKRPAVLVDMAAEILRRRDDVRFVFHGIGPMLEAMREKVNALGLEHAIKLPGKTTNAWEFDAALDVFVLSSRVEGLPNVLIEAQMMGTPVVCSGAGGMRETFVEGESGLVADATPQAFASAVLSIIDDTVRHERMSAAAADFSRRTFSIDQVLRRNLEAYARAGGCQGFSTTNMPLRSDSTPRKAAN